MKTKITTFLYIMILSTFMVNNISAANEMRVPFENTQEIYETASQARLQQQYSPFQTQSPGGLQKAFGDRPGNGDGIGQAPVNDGWWIVLIMVVGYSLEIGYRKYRKQKNSNKKNDERIEVGS